MIGRLAGLRLSRFALIGLLATAIYALLAAALVGAPGRGLSAPVASVVAYLVAALFSYAGHKYVTFASAGTHRFEIPRFALLTASGLGVAWLLPRLLTDLAGLPSLVSVAAVCIVIPMVNYVLLGRWVFGER